MLNWPLPECQGPAEPGARGVGSSANNVVLSWGPSHSSAFALQHRNRYITQREKIAGTKKETIFFKFFEIVHCI